MSNEEKYAGMTIDELMEVSDGRRCALCDEHCEKDIGPANPVCEGNWCDEALEYWLKEAAL